MEAPYHRLHSLADLDNMTIGIVEPYHMLSPGLFTNGVDELNACITQSLIERL